MKRELTHGSPFGGAEGFGSGAAPAGIKTEWSCEFEKYRTEVIKKKILEADTQYTEISERLKTCRLLTSSAADFPLPGPQRCRKRRRN
jgi:site-specific DNA-cytosine methylase